MVDRQGRLCCDRGMSRWTLVLAALLALAAGCSSSRSSPVSPDGAGDGNIAFPDGSGDMFVPPAGSSLRGELSSGGGPLQGGDVALHGVVGEPFSSAAASGGDYVLQWDSVVLPIPQ